MPKRKAMAAAITPTQRKSRGYLILDQQLSKKNKSNKNITSTPGKNLQRCYVKTNRSYCLIFILECTNWIVHAMPHILPNQKKRH